MKWVRLIKYFVFLCLWLPLPGIAQEEESAEIFLEDYTDEFQEYFFEALKQKGIENYDKAINALLKCKEMDPESPVVDHELAKMYQLNNQMGIAQEFALEALRKQPANLWYLNTYVSMIYYRSLDLDAMKRQLPYEHTELRENLARILVDKGEYDLANSLLKDLQKNELTRGLQARIADSLAMKDNNLDTESVDGEKAKDNPYLELVGELQGLLDKGQYSQLEIRSTEVLEAYPLQPFFYFTKGVALNGLGQFRSAEEYLLMGLDFLTNDEDLKNKFYKELVLAYQGLGDTDKANMYLSKLKNGS
ncbi:Tetratricopeptide repeat-containing protein [Muriicola jejuensis]|uniref:Tetratricopeptide repeat protein n=1 Tax=Muriicola jejuensis TaxID=504488 RepID=A0A6P0UF43_9FLAO|nr:hypothetical protein [Muriicola jejuensis]NER09873.1 hypothetical protein [Muriicola jejuensis]SMP05081.1 Tetratricopeptide repeat-containing protein [Muriicola jejuensis]